MANPNEYIIFEADQVLTNEHLNETFNYLDQQNRWTRNKLIGIGIVCGLDIVQNTGVISITRGCGVTSQGYLILQDDALYAYYMPYAPTDQPNDLPFTYPGDLPFFKPFCQNKTIWLLLTDEQYNALEPADQKNAQTLSSTATDFLSDYAVVLFLETKETDLKNCDIFDCNNKGERIHFQVRPLLVAKKDLPGTATAAGGEISPSRPKYLPHEVDLKRFNVPYTNLKTPDDIIKAFVRIVDDTTLSHLANAYIFAYEQYKAMLNVSVNPFTSLLPYLKKIRETILKNNPVFIQYFYDFIDDMIKAWYEFTVKISGIEVQCCPDENLFPLHLVLGDASKTTKSWVHDPYRQYFIYSALFGKINGDVSEAVFLFHRMILIVKDFTIPKVFRNVPIRVTPSQYEYPWLSKRAIPYYYHVNESGDELYKSWSFYKTSHGNASFNLSYNSNLYSTNNAVNHPLLYDIEHYNFFRIEGHIGQNYNSVMQNLLEQRLQFNLPFDVVAVSAELLTTGDTKLPVCDFNDLETAFRLLVSELACRIHLPLCYLAQLPLTGEATPAPFAQYKANAIKDAEEPPAFLQPNYKVGDFMNSRCNPDKGTLGKEYLDRIGYPKTLATIREAFLSNLVRTESFNLLLIVFHFFDFVERLMMLLLTNSLSSLDKASFTESYNNYARSLGTLATLLQPDEIKNSGFAVRLDNSGLYEELNSLMSFCFDERLLLIIGEYLRRLHLYNLELSFLRYFRKHPGLEHKAGVPKGGTFVLVYHKAQVRATNILLQETGLPVVTETFTPVQIDLIRNFINDCNNAPTIEKQQILEFLPPAEISPSRFTLADGEVIADFYIPYLCCSDCPPVAYMLTGTTPAQEKPVIKMGSVFCDNDSNPSKIEVSVPGGTFNDVPGIDPEALTFTPSKAGKGNYSVIYTVNGVASDPVNVTVLPTPSKIDFKAQPPVQTGNIFTMKFIPSIEDTNFNYQWTFDPKVFTKATSTDESQVMQLVKPPRSIRTTVSLIISNKCGTAKIGHKLLITSESVEIIS